MKHQVFKRLAAFALAFVVAAASFAVGGKPALAAENYKITIVPSGTTVTPDKNSEKSPANRFKAYQIFSGEVTAELDELANVNWGSALLKPGTALDTHDYTAIKKLLEDLAEFDWDGDSTNQAKVEEATDDGKNVVKIEDPADKAADEVQKAFAEIYKTAYEDIENYDAATEHGTEEEDKYYACQTAAEEVIDLLIEKTKAPATTAYKDDLMQKFAKVVSGIVTAAGRSGYAEPLVSTWNGTQWEITVPNDQPGYYLVEDTVTDPADGDSITPYMLDVFRNVTVKIKSTSPKLNKSITGVTSNAKAQSGKISDSKNSAVANVGDVITYTLEGTLPANFATFYDKFEYTFTDTLSDGLDINIKNATSPLMSEVKVELTLDEGANWMQIKNYYTASYADTTRTLTVSFKDDKNLMAYMKDASNGYGKDRVDTAFAGSGYDVANITDWKKAKIRVTYQATLNDEAELKNGNDNTAYLTYTDNPNTESTYTNTPKEAPKVYTFQINLIKQSDELSPKKLSGAKFRVGRENGTSTADTEYAIFKKDGDTYILEEWYKFDDIDNTANVSAYLDTLKSKYPGADLTVIVESNADGQLNIKGFSEGSYIVTETESPADYDKADPFIVNLKASTDSTGEYDGGLSTSETTVTYPSINKNPDKNAESRVDQPGSQASNGIAEVVVTDPKASILPHTGGSGVYFYYIGGGLLVALALVALIFNKRKTGEKA